MKSVDICKPQDCALCMACVNTCPVSAIHIAHDEMGFEAICVDEEKCVDCGACARVCKARKSIEKRVPDVGYVGQAKDNQKLACSASGGAFQMLAEIILERGGVCYGSEFCKDSFDAKHVRIDNKQDMARILNSKYIPSLIGTAYQQAKADLQADKWVLFCGTPCQIQGLKAYLNKEYDKLLCADLICHGVTATKWFHDYVALTEKQRHIKVVDYQFRDKSVSWGTNYCYSYYKTNDPHKRIKTQHCPREGSSYMIQYLRGNIFRENCYSCELSSSNRVSDFTLGDFWGIELEYPELVLNKDTRLSLRRGVSCLLLNTPKAQDFIPSLQEKMKIFPVEVERIVRHNGNLREASKPGKSREHVLSTYAKHGYAPIEAEYQASVGKKRHVYNLKNTLKSILPDRLRIFIYRTPWLSKWVFH